MGFGALEIGDLDGLGEPVKDLQIVCFGEEANEIIGDGRSDGFDVGEFGEGFAVPVFRRHHGLAPRGV